MRSYSVDFGEELTELQKSVEMLRSVIHPGLDFVGPYYQAKDKLGLITLCDSDGELAGVTSVEVLQELGAKA